MRVGKRGFLLTAVVAFVGAVGVAGLSGCGKDEAPPASKPSAPRMASRSVAGTCKPG